MALIQKTLESALETRIKSLENKLATALADESNGLYKSQELTSTKIKDSIPKKNFDTEKFNKNVWKITAENDANAIAKQLLSVLAPELSKIIADEITKYLITATVTCPAGAGVVS